MKNAKFGKHRLGLDDQTALYNVENQLYYGPLFIGSENIEMQVIFDTGSDWLMIESTDCKTCEGAKYDWDKSTYFNRRTVVQENRTYGTIIHLQGYRVTDQVCLGRGENCVSPFSWLLIEE